MSTSAEMLFACTNCHKRYKFEELSANQQLCKVCRRRFPSVVCTYCRLEFHPIKSSASKDIRPACESCSRDFKQHGTPSFCSICNLQSAFNGKKCSRCIHSQKKYGPPVSCENCKLVCAFKKPDDVKKKVEGKTLCLLCTINYKKAMHKKRAREQGPLGKADVRTANPMKRVKVEAANSSPVELSSLTTSSGHHKSILDEQFDPLSTNHLLQTERLQNEVSSLKKQLVQKDQTLLDKDKAICGLKAESSERERDYRQKIQSIQKSHSDSLENLQVEIRNLKKQLSQATRSSSKKDVKESGPS